MKHLLITLLVVYAFGLVQAQSIPSNYGYYTKIYKPNIKRAFPSDLMFDNQQKHMAVSYGYNPAHVYIYETTEFEIVQVFKIRHFVYFASSYFGTTSDGNIYIDNGHNKVRYHQCNLKTGEKTKIPCEKTPGGCDFYKDYITKMEFDAAAGVYYVKGPGFALKVSGSFFEIYLPEETNSP